jgi:glucosyl-3-phosphoglycerate synthase
VNQLWQELLQRWRGWLRLWLKRARVPGAPAGGAAGGPAEALPRPRPQALPLAPCVTVVIPALNEAKRIASVVTHAKTDDVTAEVVVIDDSSVDDTAALAQSAGARVVTSTMLGKGPSMQDGVNEARFEIVAYLDGDLGGLQPQLITKLVTPILRDEADFVKARFGRSGGRVTELTAKPMLKVFFPELAAFRQPLGGIIAARRSLLQQLAFEDGYGVDIGLLVDAHRAGARIVEVDIGSLENDSQPLQDLHAMANEVSRVIYSRARAAGRLNVDQIVAMYENQRQAAATLEYVMSRRRGRQRLLLLDMDGTLTSSRYVWELARATGQAAALAPLIDTNDDAATRSERIAALFRFVHKTQFETVARSLPIRPGVVEFVNRMRRAGFMVGVLSDSYFVAAEILRKRIFADFALGHLLQFDAEVCTGQIRLNPAYMPEDGVGDTCKSHVLKRFRGDPDDAPLVECWAVGDNLNDLPLLQTADRAFALDPKADALRHLPGVTVVAGFEELLALVPTVQEVTPEPADVS